MFEKIARLIKESKRTTVITGAGVSTPSGLCDFRSQDGRWSKYNPLKVGEGSVNIGSPEFLEFYRDRYTEVSSHKPNRAHHILKEWQDNNLVSNIITQNVDGYHGSKDVIELHGNINRYYCPRCGKRYSAEEYMHRTKCRAWEYSLSTGYKYCSATIRPDIVLLNEEVHHLEQAMKQLILSDLVIILGTSLTVAPVSTFPLWAHKYGANVVMINMEPITSAVSKYIDYSVYGKDIVDSLVGINKYLK